MFQSLFFLWLLLTGSVGNRHRQPFRSQPNLELLEDRVVPANFTWIGASVGQPQAWEVKENWQGGTVQQPLPGPNDKVVITADKAITINSTVTILAIEIQDTFKQTLTIGAGGTLTLSPTQDATSIFKGGAGSKIIVTPGPPQNEERLVINGNFDWWSGDLTGNGKVKIDANGHFYFWNEVASFLNINMNNRGEMFFAPSVNVTVGNIAIDNYKTFDVCQKDLVLAPMSNPVLINRPGATLNKKALENDDVARPCLVNRCQSNRKMMARLTIAR